MQWQPGSEKRKEWRLKATVELKKSDIKMLIGLVTEEIDRIGEAKEKRGFYDLSFFYRLIDIGNKLLAMPLDTELPSGFSDEELLELFNYCLDLVKALKLDDIIHGK